MFHLRAAVIAALFSIGWGLNAAAQDVKLTAREGNVSVTGTLLSYDGEIYRIQTEFGVVAVDGFRVICEGPGCPDLTALVQILRFSGSRTMGEVLMPALVETFAMRKGLRTQRLVTDDTRFDYRFMDPETEDTVAEVRFRVTTPGEGFADLVADEADLVLSTREPTAQEAMIAREAGFGDLSVARRALIVALDGLVPIVSRRNPLSAIDYDDLGHIFSGEITDWTELGAAGRIQLHLRNEDSGLTEEFRRRVFEDRTSQFARDVTFHPDNASVADAVARDPRGLGIAAFSNTGNAKLLDLAGPCGKTISPSVANLKTEDYPLTTPLFIYAPIGRPSPLAREFMSYIRSRAAQPVIARSGFIDLRVALDPLDRQGRRLANAIIAAGEETSLTELKRLVAEMEGSSRLTLSFRFEPGGTRLDAQSRSNIETLAEELEQGRFDDRSILFVGFTDGDGPADANLRLARRRADTVRRAVMSSAPAADRERLDIQVLAFGEAMPMACDDVEWGRGVNRRVEVWVR